MLLTVDPTVAADQFQRRRRELQLLSAHHPERDVDEDSIDEVVEGASAQLAVIAAARPEAMTGGSRDSASGRCRRFGQPGVVGALKASTSIRCD